MTPLARLLLLPALALTSLVATAAPERYALDPVHTRVLFAVEHAGFSKALGTVSGTSGTLIFDPDDWAAARLDVTVPLHRADLGDAKWNEATLARNLLDAERFPDAHFVSTRVEASGENHAKVTGNLTLHGVTRRSPWTSPSTRLNAIRSRRSAAPPASRPPPRCAVRSSGSMRGNR